MPAQRGRSWALLATAGAIFALGMFAVAVLLGQRADGAPSLTSVESPRPTTVAVVPSPTVASAFPGGSGEPPGATAPRLSPATSPSPLPRWSPPPGGAQGFVRLNQVGYDPAQPAAMRAYLLSPVPAGASTFAVLDQNGGVVLSAPVPTTSLGSWNGAFSHVFGLDFPAVVIPGTYRIAVGGAIVAMSPTFRVDASARLYGPLLANALLFYQAQRDGPEVIRSVLDRAPAHLNDRAALVYAPPVYDTDGVLAHDLRKVGGPVDATGGWFDAGDYVKFVQTTSYVEDVMLAAIRDQPSQLGPGSAADLTAEARFGLDWLQRMWDDQTATLYYQVGIGDGSPTILADHDIWRLPQADDTYGGTDTASRAIRHRPVFRAGPPGSRISPNLAGRLAAAFAECYQVFRLTDRPYAERCLRSGEHVFALANTAPRQLLTVAPYDFYPETQWRDDLELGATELYRALVLGDAPADLTQRDPAFYLQQAAHWAHAYLSGPKDFDSLNLYDVAGLAHYELAVAIRDATASAGLDVQPAALVADMRRRLDDAVTRATRDPFGFGGNVAEFDSAAHAFGLAVMASEVDRLTGTTAYAEFGRRQLGALLGANAWGTSLVVGAGTTYPHCMQHQVANLSGSLDGTAPLVLGAVVNGPNAPQSDLGVPDGARACVVSGFARFDGHGGHYADDVASWPTVEPALDYSVLQFLAFSRAAAGQE